MVTQFELPLTPRDLIDLLSRHKKKLLILPALALLFGLAIMIFFPRTYRSQAKIFLQVGRESVGIDPTATMGQTIAMQQSGRDDEVQSALEVLRSRGVIGAAVDLVGPEVVLGDVSIGPDGEDSERESSVLANVLFAVPRAMVGWLRSFDPISAREEAIICVERALEVGAERDSAVIVIKYDAESPQLAQRVCEAIVDAYRREHVRIHRNADSSDFFDGQQALLRTQLENAEQRVREAKNEMGLATIEGRRETLEAQFSAVALHRYETDQKLATATARVEDLHRQLSELPERVTSANTSVPNDGADLLRDQYYALQLKEMDLRARYRDEHPLVQTVSQQVADAKRVLDAVEQTRFETTDDVNPVYRELTLDLKKQTNLIAGLQAQRKELGAQQEKILADLKAINRSEVEIAQREREAEIARGKYIQYAEYFEEARIDRERAVDRISNVSVVQAATLQEKPVSPSKLLVALATMFFAVFGTAAAILTSERINQPIRQGRRNGRALDEPVYAGQSEGIPKRQKVH